MLCLGGSCPHPRPGSSLLVLGSALPSGLGAAGRISPDALRGVSFLSSPPPQGPSAVWQVGTDGLNFISMLTNEPSDLELVGVSVKQGDAFPGILLTCSRGSLTYNKLDTGPQKC